MFADAPIDRYARGERHALQRRTEAGRGALLRPRRLRGLPRGRGRVQRDVQRLPRARDRRAAGRPVGRQRRCSTVPARTRTSAWSRSPGTPGGPLRVPHVAAAQRRAPADVHAQRRLRASRGCHPSPPRRGGVARAPTPRATSLPICADRPVRSRRCSSGWIRCCARRSHLTDAEFADLVDFVRNGLLDPRPRPRAPAAARPRAAPQRPGAAQVPVSLTVWAA